MHRSGPAICQRFCNRGFVETFLTNDDKASSARLIHSPGTVKTFLKALADALDEHPSGLAAHLDKALDPQDVVALRDFGQLTQQEIGVVDGSDFNDGAVKIDVIMIGLPIMVRWPRGNIVFGSGVKT